MSNASKRILILDKRTKQQNALCYPDMFIAIMYLCPKNNYSRALQTTAFIYCYIDTVIGLSIVKFHIFAVKRKQLELWKALTIL